MLPETLGEPVSSEIPVDPMLLRISLPEGFSISLYSNKVPGARSLALGTDGILFVGTRSRTVYALRDNDGDNYAETVHIIADNLNTPNGVAFRNGALYVAEINRVLRYDGIESRLAAPPDPVVVVDTLPRDTHHGWKFIRFGPDGKLYVPVGAPCNVCKRNDERYAAILRVDPDGRNLEIFAHGVRNTVGFDWHPESGVLWFTDNGRDNISRDQRINDNSPPDELNRAGEPGLHFGFPYCHGANVQDPQFGSERGCDEFTPPQRELPAHVAALGMRFYTGSMFPASWKNVIFIAEHGSWNRSEPIGYRVTSVRLDKSGDAVSYDVFAQGWLGSDGTAWGRPVDVLILPDGALLVSDDRRGAVYRISH
jgi:glucose/arabinose dehydrogenase